MENGEEEFFGMLKNAGESSQEMVASEYLNSKLNMEVKRMTPEERDHYELIYKGIQEFAEDDYDPNETADFIRNISESRRDIMRSIILFSNYRAKQDTSDERGNYISGAAFAKRFVEITRELSQLLLTDEQK